VTTYRSSTVFVQLARLQDELYEHLTGDAAGRCTTCRQLEPCARRAELTSAIVRSGALPRRRPGMTKAGLRRVGGVWRRA